MPVYGNINTKDTVYENIHIRVFVVWGQYQLARITWYFSQVLFNTDWVGQVWGDNIEVKIPA